MLSLTLGLMVCLKYFYPDSLSHTQGYLMTYFDWTCVAWVSVITANGYRLIKEEISYESSESLFHLICWFIPALLAGIPFIWDAYGHSGPWW